MIGVFLFGTIWGSFFFTLALRHADEAFSKNRLRILVLPSRCPRCGTRIRMHELIPLLGYFIARGRCRACGSAISPLYPASELCAGLLACAVYLKYGLTLYSLAGFLVLGLAAAVSFVDAKKLEVPDAFCAAIAAISLYPALSGGAPLLHVIGAVGMFLFFALIVFIFPGGFGGGDVKFAAALGFFSGIWQSIVILECALVAGSVAGAAYALVTRKGLRARIPFAPFLALGLSVSFFFGEEIALIYRGLFL